MPENKPDGTDPGDWQIAWWGSDNVSEAIHDVIGEGARLPRESELPSAELIAIRYIDQDGNSVYSTLVGGVESYDDLDALVDAMIEWYSGELA